MSTVAISEKDLNEKSSRKNKAAGYIGAIVYTIVIVVLTFLQIFSKQDPVPEPGGLMASLGNVEIAGSGNAESNSENTPSEPTPAETQDNKIETNDDIKSTSVNTDPKPDKPSNNNNNAAEDDGPKGLNFGEYKGNGNDKGNGKQGSPDGKDDNLGNVGNGQGDRGDGVDEGKSGRECVNCSKCSVSDTWTEVGDAYVSILVSPEGKVTESKMADVKKYPKNANFYGKQKTIAEECAKQRTYKPSDKSTRMVVKISFRKG